MSVDSASGVSGRDEFLQWAKGALIPLSTLSPEQPWDDLRPLGDMIGDAQVVALSEGVHGAAEPLEFRNRVLPYLVKSKNFTAIAIESGVVEGRIVHDYVRGGPGELASVMHQGISWTFDRLPQNEYLVRWLRAYNENPLHGRKVNLYGFDMPGSPGNPFANRGVATALEEALHYLDRVDQEAGTALRSRLASLLPRLRFSFYGAADAPSYEQLVRAERDALTAAVADLVTLIERQEGQYTARSTAEDYAWAHRVALGARQADGWLREIPEDWHPVHGSAACPGEPMWFLSSAIDVRDRAQADNLDWIIRREGADGKLLIFAHRYHLSSTPVEAAFCQSRRAEQAVAGTYLRRRLGSRLVTIGNLIRHGEYFDGLGRQVIKDAAPESLDRIAGELGVPRYLLDVRGAPGPVSRWLSGEQQLLGEESGTFRLAGGRAFDILFYTDVVTPARATDSQRSS